MTFQLFSLAFPLTKKNIYKWFVPQLDCVSPACVCSILVGFHGHSCKVFHAVFHANMHLNRIISGVCTVTLATLENSLSMFLLFVKMNMICYPKTIDLCGLQRSQNSECFWAQLFIENDRLQ